MHNALQSVKDHQKKGNRNFKAGENKSPHEQKENIVVRNRNMPLKVEQRRKKEDLGMEIFEVRKELGLVGGHTSLEKIHSDRSKVEKANRVLQTAGEHYD